MAQEQQRPVRIESGGYIVKAFPNVTGEKGMDLRDYFAAKAMQGMLANRGVIYGTNADKDDYNGAKRAYKIADAMMKAREQDGN
jgi:hypothetical protein